MPPRLRLMLLLLAALLAPLRADADEKPAGRPNVLWITCEDMSATLGCYGDRYAVTPHLDQLATQSVRYTRAFTVAGVCAPSRSCLITGMYPSSLGTHHMRCTGTLPPEVTCFTKPLRDAGYWCSNNVKEDYNFQKPPGSWDESNNKAHWKNRKAGQPFFSVFNIVTTHEGQIRSNEQAYKRNTERLKPEEFHDPAKAPLPAYLPDTPVVRRDWARHSDLITAMDKRVGDILKELDDDGLAEDTIVFFFSDHGVGLPRGKRWLYDSGTHVPLLIRFPKKHAALASGKPGSTSDRLVSFVDFGATVQGLCGVKVPAHVQGKPFLGEQAAKPREYVFGIRDRMDERYDFTRAVRDGRYKYIRNYLPHLPWAQPLTYMDEMPTMREWRKLSAEKKLSGPSANFLAATKPVEELYDTEKDPHEVHNLAGSAAHREVLERMRKALTVWQKETMDLGFLQEAEIHLRCAGRAPFTAVRKDEKLYPLDRIRAAAEAMHAAGDVVPRLVELAKDDDAAVRRWAAVGLGVRGGVSKNAVETLLKAREDSSPVVKVAAAEALGRLGKHDDGRAVLELALKHENEWVRLQAINVLDGWGEKTRPSLEALQAVKGDKNQYVLRVLEHALKSLGE